MFIFYAVQRLRHSGHCLHICFNYFMYVTVHVQCVCDGTYSRLREYFKYFPKYKQIFTTRQLMPKLSSCEYWNEIIGIDIYEQKVLRVFHNTTITLIMHKFYLNYNPKRFLYLKYFFVKIKKYFLHSVFSVSLKLFCI